MGVAAIVGGEVSDQAQVAEQPSAGVVVLPGEEAYVLFQQRRLAAEVGEQDTKGTQGGLDRAWRPPAGAGVGQEAVAYLLGGRCKSWQAPLVQAGLVAGHVEQLELSAGRSVVARGTCAARSAHRLVPSALQAAWPVEAIGGRGALSWGQVAAEPQLVTAERGGSVQVVRGLGQHQHAPRQ
ncbi:hypothetical protein [Streptomyces sp. NBC_00063]|uniref:hypothetical protein n=1 Tax=Streptomyces sp. NBC_00063 TaxID=2975638 RepID=UPI003D70B6F5